MDLTEIKTQLKVILDNFLGRENIDSLIESSEILESEIETICNSFFGDELKKEKNILCENSLVDLEIFQGLGNDINNSIFNYINRTNTNIGKFLLKKIIANPTDDISKLIKRQNVIKNLYQDKEKLDILNKKILVLGKTEDKLLWLWKDLNDETKYLFNMVYFQSRFLRWLNKNELAMRLYNYYAIIFSPIYGILSPILMFLAPFILLKFYFRDNISFKNYFSIIKILLSGFTNIFKVNYNQAKNTNISFSLTNIISFLVWAVFYIHALFSNVYNAINTNKITNILHNKLNNISKAVRSGHDIYELLAKDINNDNLFTECNVEKHFRILWDDIFDEKPNLYSNKGRILKTYKIISEQRDKLKDLIKYIGNIDVFLGLVKLKNEDDYCFSTFTKDKLPFIDADNITYPINNKNMVSNSIKLGLSNPKNACITGPNAGGKSTFIKSLCLSLILSQTLTITPAKAFNFTPFYKIHTYLNIPDCKGKESLFEAEMNRSLKYIDCIRKIPKNKFSFVIMDEIFSSTNPEEGIAGAYAIANNISKSSNSISIITSHYSYLSKLETTGKYRNYKIPITRDAENNIVYKYKLEQGVSNQFIALELLEKKGFDIEIVKEAKDICKNLSGNNFKNRSFTEDVRNGLIKRKIRNRNDNKIKVDNENKIKKNNLEQSETVVSEVLKAEGKVQEEASETVIEVVEEQAQDAIELQASETESSKAEASKAEASKAEASKAESSKAESRKAEASKAEVQVETREEQSQKVDKID